MGGGGGGEEIKIYEETRRNTGRLIHSMRTRSRLQCYTQPVDPKERQASRTARSWSSGMAVAMVVWVGMGMERPWCAVVGDA
ncbi:unnamed protein product [Sphagnum troendelagicum]|uniref:Uncharacterized protein n=1 Tax=Sphagnum troendelagicum TaxID=128251 RepID=A0ABP0UMH9_9BRYO